MKPPTVAAVVVALALALSQAACAGLAWPMSGTTRRELVVGGVTRTYLVHAGGAAKPGRALVLVLHGLGGTGAAIQRRTRGTFDKLADRDGAVIVYPNAAGADRWTDGWAADAPGAALPDDVAFLSALVDSAVAEYGIDRKRVFAAGLSNGAGMAYRLACERPDVFAAIAPVSGGMSAAVARSCSRGAPVSIIHMHGTDDSIVPIDRGILETITTWVRRDGCPAQATSSRLADTAPDDGTQTRVDVHAPCAGGAEVALYTIEGGGHAWPGGDEPWRHAFRSGHTARDFDAGLAIWDFFQKHPRR